MSQQVVVTLQLHLLLFQPLHFGRKVSNDTCHSPSLTSSLLVLLLRLLLLLRWCRCHCWRCCCCRCGSNWGGRNVSTTNTTSCSCSSPGTCPSATIGHLR